MDRFFSVVVSEHQKTVFGLLFSLLRDRQLAEDLTQETFLVLLRKIDVIDVSRPVLPWLLSTARNLALNARRRRALEDRLFVSGETAQGLWEELGGSELGADWDERLGALRSCREDLSDPQKKVVDLFYSKGLTSKEIAGKLGAAAEAIHNRLTRGRATLRQCIEHKLRGAS